MGKELDGYCSNHGYGECKCLWALEVTALWLRDYEKETSKSTPTVGTPIVLPKHARISHPKNLPDVKKNS